MAHTTHKSIRILKSLKKRLSTKFTNEPISISKPDLVSNLRRAIHSTPNLLKFRHAHDNPSVTSLSPELPTMDRDSMESGSSPTASESSFSLGDLSSSTSSFFKHCRGSAVTPASTTRVLFSPSKPITASPRSRLHFNFALKKSKSGTEFQISNDLACPLPMITLTAPDDDDTYFLTRPFPVVSNSFHLFVPTRPSHSYSHKTSRELTSKQWPHPAGPWLRPSSHETSLSFKDGPWAAGTRLADGRVVGWDDEHLEAMGVQMPPHLPTEQDLRAIALVEEISTSLDRAQDALYGTLDVGWGVTYNKKDGVYGASHASWIYRDLMEDFEEELYSSEIIEIIE